MGVLNGGLDGVRKARERSTTALPMAPECMEAGIHLRGGLPFVDDGEIVDEWSSSFSQKRAAPPHSRPQATPPPTFPHSTGIGTVQHKAPARTRLEAPTEAHAGGAWPLMKPDPFQGVWAVAGRQFHLLRGGRRKCRWRFERRAANPMTTTSSGRSFSALTLPDLCRPVPPARTDWEGTTALIRSCSGPGYRPGGAVPPPTPLAAAP
jgi:hypothetical protein